MSNALNIVFYAPSFDSLGGGEIWLNRLANELRRRSHNVTVIGKRRPVSRVVGAWEEGIDRVYLIDGSVPSVPAVTTGALARVRTEVARILATTGLGRRLDRLIGGRRPPGMFQRDIPLEAHARLVQLISASQTRAAGVPTVVICSDVYTASHVSAAVARGELRLDRVIVHHLSFASLSQGTCRALRQAAGPAATVVALTDEDAAAFRRAGFPRVESVPNPNPNPDVDPVPAAPGSTLGREPLVVWLGRMTTQKSAHLAVEAWSRMCRSHPEWRLSLYGDGEERPHILARIDALGVGDSVTLAGLTDDPRAVFTRASVNLLPSQFEGWGLVIGEAGLQGVPTIAFDCAPGVRAQIDHRVNGILVPLNRVDAFAAELDAVISDDQLRGALGAAARTRALEFSPARVGELWDRLLVTVTAH